MKLSKFKKINWWNTKFQNREKKFLLKAFDEKNFTSGKNNLILENRLKNIFGSKYCITCNSGTSALIMSLIVLGIKPGDEIIIPNFTWVATANAAAILGAKLRLVDCKKNSPIMDENKIESLINSRTKAIITVNFHGRSCNYEKILLLGKKYKINIIEDNCKGIKGISNKKKLGTIGTMGCHSLGMISLLPVGFGGFIVTNKASLAKKLKYVRDNGVNRDFNDEKLSLLGANFKLSGLLASLANSQMSKLNIKIKRLKKIYKLYKNNLNNPHIKFLDISIDTGEIPLCVDLFSKHRRKLEKYLQSKGILISKFHVNISESKLVNIKKKKQLYKNSYLFSNYGFMPPCGPDQNLKDISYVIREMNNWRP